MKKIIKQLKRLNFSDLRPIQLNLDPDFYFHKFVRANPEIAPLYVLNIEVYFKQKILFILYYLEHGLERDLIHFSSKTNIKSKIDYYLNRFYTKNELMSYLGFELVSSPNAIGLYFYKEIENDLIMLVKYKDFVPFNDFPISVYDYNILYSIFRSQPIVVTTYNKFNLEKCTIYSIKKMGL